MKKLLFYIVLLIPIINGLATATTGYFEPGTLNPGTIRAFIIGLPVVFFIMFFYPTENLNLMLLVYVCYLFLLVFLSSDVLWSFYMYIKIAIGFLMFPLGYYFIRSRYEFGLLMKSFIITLGLLLLNILVANIFHLGTSDYLNESFYFGAGRVNITTSMMVLVLTSPVAFHYFKDFQKRLVVMIFIAGLLVSIIGIKRSVLLTAIISPFIYGFFTRHKLKVIRAFFVSVLLFTVSLLIFPGYYRIFSDRLEARQEAGSLELSNESLNNQARVSEYNLVIETWVDGSLKHKLFGSEWLNDMAFFKAGRMLHTDYMVLLNGSGIIGFLFWFWILFMIFRRLFFYHRFLKRDSFFNDIFAISLCMLAAQLIMSISGSLYSIDLRSIIMLFWGAAYGTMKSEYASIYNESCAGVPSL